jgi:hypothetical protein
MVTQSAQGDRVDQANMLNEFTIINGCSDDLMSINDEESAAMHQASKWLAEMPAIF